MTSEDAAHSIKKINVLKQTTYDVKVFNPLGPSDAIWRHKSGSTLAQVMTCCLTAPSHYLNQCWLIISKVEWHLMASSQEMPQPSITEIICKIKYLNFHSNFPGTNELRLCYDPYTVWIQPHIFKNRTCLVLKARPIKWCFYFVEIFVLSPQLLIFPHGVNTWGFKYYLIACDNSHYSSNGRRLMTSKSIFL